MQADIMGRTHKEMIHILATLFVSLTRHSLYQGICGERREGRKRTTEQKNEGQANPGRSIKERQEQAGWPERERERGYKSVKTICLAAPEEGESSEIARVA